VIAFCKIIYLVKKILLLTFMKDVCIISYTNHTYHTPARIIKICRGGGVWLRTTVNMRGL